MIKRLQITSYEHSHMFLPFQNNNLHKVLNPQDSMAKVDDLRKAFSPRDLTDARWQDVHSDEMYELGIEAANLLRGKKIVLGADSRKMSYEMLRNFKKGYEKNRGKVTDCGNHCTSPMIEYLGHLYGLPSVMITASHLDESWQGIKIRPGKGSQKKAAQSKKEAFEDYVESFPKNDFKGLSTTVDYLEGTVARFFPVIAARNNICVREALNAGMTGDYTSFFMHAPDPTIPENLTSIFRAMKANDSRLGVAFDGDGDRHVFILRYNNEVRAIDPVLLITLSAMYYEDPGVFVLDPFVIPAGKAVVSLGHEIARVRRGRPRVIAGILELKNQGKRVYKGMEGSYHGYDDEGFDDGIRQVLEFCQYLMKGIDMEKAREIIGYDYTLEMRVKCRNDTLFREDVVPVLARLGRDRGLSVDTTDGVQVKDSFVVRKSYREEVVSFLFYGKDSQEEMENAKDAISSVYQELAEDLEKKFGIMQKYKRESYW